MLATELVGLDLDDLEAEAFEPILLEELLAGDGQTTRLIEVESLLDQRDLTFNAALLLDYPILRQYLFADAVYRRGLSDPSAIVAVAVGWGVAVGRVVAVRGPGGAVAGATGLTEQALPLSNSSQKRIAFVTKEDTFILHSLLHIFVTDSCLRSPSQYVYGVRRTRAAVLLLVKDMIPFQGH